MRSRLLLSVGILTLVLPASGFAAPLPNDTKGATGPQLVVQVQSIDQLLGKVKQTAKNFLPDKMYGEFEKNVLAKVDPKELPGINFAKPFGFYASVDAEVLKQNFEKSTAVLLVPTTSEKEFLAMLEKFQAPIEKKEDGLYAIKIPNAPIPVMMRFSKDYAHIGVAGTNLEQKRLISPGEFFDPKETAAMVVRGRIDRVPQELRDAILGFMDQAIAQAKNAPMQPFEKEIFEQFMGMALRWYKLGLNDGREFVERIDLDVKTASIVVEATLDGKPDSELAKYIKNMPETKNPFTGIFGSDAVGKAMFSAPLGTEEVRSILVKLTEKGAEMFGKEAKDAPPEAVTLVTEGLKALGRTVKSGEMSLAAGLRGPTKNGEYTAIGAIQLKDTAPVEKALRGAVKLVPEKIQKVLKMDAAKIGNLAVHELDFTKELPEEAQKIFGKSPKLSVVFAADAIYLAFGVDGMNVLKDAINSKGGPAPTLHAEVNGKRLATLIKAAHPDLPKEAEDMLRKFDNMPLLTLEVTGGEKMTVRYTYGGGLIAAVMWFSIRAEGVGPGAAKPPVIEKK